jgi:serine/threonine-protein kinase
MTNADPASVPPTRRVDQQLAPRVVVGEVIADKYRIEGLIGRGGMGLVVAASQLTLDRRVAIKLIRDEWAQDPLAVARLIREAKAAASIQSEHVARVLDVGTLQDGAPFIVMEYLDGLDLDTLLRRDGALATADAVDFMLQACEAIAEAHRNGIVHRDLKPANVFIARLPGGVPCVKVVDFGISKVIGVAADSLTHPSRVVGSLYHMAPEQMRGKAVDARTDVWALGVLLFEMLTARSPFREAAWPDICAQVLHGTGPIGALDGAVPAELQAIIQKCLSRSADDRYDSVAELAQALAPFGKHTAHHSLERIQRLAAATGEHAAVWSPSPPFGLADTDEQRTSSLDRRTPFVPHSAEESVATRKPVVTSVSPPATANQRALRGGVILGLAAVVAVALVQFTRGQGPARSVERLEPTTAASASNAAPSVPASTPPAESKPSGPTISVVRTPPPAPSPAPVAAKVEAAPKAPVARPSPPAPAPGSSEIIRELPAADEREPAAPSVAAPPPVAAPSTSPAPGAPPATAVPPRAAAPAASKPIDPWDLDSVSFKRKGKVSP